MEIIQQVMLAKTKCSTIIYGNNWIILMYKIFFDKINCTDWIVYTIDRITVDSFRETHIEYILKLKNKIIEK